MWSVPHGVRDTTRPRFAVEAPHRSRLSAVNEKNFDILFVAGVPATGKSWLGKWLAEQHGYLHINAERDSGVDFDRAGIHGEWDELIMTQRATRFVEAIRRLARPVILDWGFPTRLLEVVRALQAEGVRVWWFRAEHDMARLAFIARGGIDPRCFDRQMADIKHDWVRITSVFGARIVDGLHPNGSQRTPQEIWAKICASDKQGA